MTNNTYPNLFSPIQIGSKSLRNRVVHASMSLRYVKDGKVNNETINYYLNRAKGGVSMAVTEPMGTTRWNIAPRRIKVFGKSNEDGLKRFSDIVGSNGCHMIGQLQDSGRGNHEGGKRQDAVSASSLPDGISWTVARSLTTEEIKIMINDFAKSSEWLMKCGWSGIEISAGHGHIFHQFLSPNSNIRDDDYGGSRENRTRLIVDVVNAIRSLSGKNFIIGLKLPGDDEVKGGIDLEESKLISKNIASACNVDYVTYCWGAHSDSLYRHLPDLHGERAPFISQIKSLSEPFKKTPVGALGLITDPNEGDYAIENGNADLVMLGRPLVTDASWANKSLNNNEAQIRYCVSLNTCWHSITSGNKIKCDNNPRVGEKDEFNWKPNKTSKKKKIVIVGAGIAGMEAAWIAKARGHDVTVFCASAEPGGKTRLHAYLPGGENLSSIYDYQILRAKKEGVKLETGIVASASDVLGLNPDSVIFASGASMIWPSCLPIDLKEEGIIPDLRDTMTMLLDRPSSQEGNAIIYDCDHTKMTYSSAEWLASKFEKTFIITPRDRIASDEPLVNRQGIYSRLYKMGINIITSSEIDSLILEEGKISLKNIYNNEIVINLDNLSLLTYATPRSPNLEILSQIRDADVEYFLIGDAKSPGSVVNATGSGNQIGLDI